MNYPAHKKIEQIDLLACCKSSTGGLLKVEIASIEWINDTEDGFCEIIDNDHNFPIPYTFPMEIDRDWITIPFLPMPSWTENEVQDKQGCVYQQEIQGRIKALNPKAALELKKMKNHKWIVKVTDTSKRDNGAKYCWLIGNTRNPLKMNYQMSTGANRADEKIYTIFFSGLTLCSATTYHEPDNGDPNG